MRRLRYWLHSAFGEHGHWPMEGTLVDLLIDIDHLLSPNRPLPSFEEINAVLLYGDDGNLTWDPFTITRDEYAEAMQLISADLRLHDSAARVRSILERQGEFEAYGWPDIEEEGEDKIVVECWSIPEPVDELPGQPGPAREPELHEPGIRYVGRWEPAGPYHPEELLQFEHECEGEELWSGREPVDELWDLAIPLPNDIEQADKHAR